jgi:AbrB family looped-hinge helix DNA binding protein
MERITVHDLETRITSKGQITIPAAIRHRLGLKPRDKVQFELAGDAAIIRPAPSKLLAGYGAVAPTARPEDWRKVREDFEQGVAEEVTAETP